MRIKETMLSVACCLYLVNYIVMLALGVVVVLTIANAARLLCKVCKLWAI